MIYRIIAYSLITFGLTGTIYLGFEGIYGDAYETPTRTLSSVERQLADSSRVILIDVRTAEEVRKRPTPWAGVIHIPLLDLEARCLELKDSVQTPIVVLCPTGARSAEGARILRLAGFDAAFIEGGMFQGMER